MIHNQARQDSPLYSLPTIVFFVLLGVFTFVTGVFVDRYHDYSPELLVNPGFDNGLLGWQATGAVTTRAESLEPLTSLVVGQGGSFYISTVTRDEPKKRPLFSKIKRGL